MMVIREHYECPVALLWWTEEEAVMEPAMAVAAIIGLLGLILWLSAYLRRKPS